jgi:hypothetical protein
MAKDDFLVIHLPAVTHRMDFATVFLHLPERIAT